MSDFALPLALFLGGLASGLHCAGMCGPLALALPTTGSTRANLFAGRAAYNLGRILTYGLLGALFGLLGQTLSIAGLQRWVSLIAGARSIRRAADPRTFSPQSMAALCGGPPHRVLTMYGKAV